MTILRRWAPHDAAPAVPVIRGELLAYRPKLVLLPGQMADRALTGDRAAALTADAVVRGGEFIFPGADGAVTYGTDYPVAHAAHTVLWVGTPAAWSSGYPMLFGYQTGLNSRRKAFLSNTGPSYGDLSFGSCGFGDDATARQFAVPGIAIGQRQSLVMRAAGTTSAALSAWSNGRALAVNGSNSIAAVSGPNSLGQDGPTGNDYIGRVQLFALFDAILPDALCQELSANPWAMFAQRRRIGGSTAAGASTSSSTESATAADSPTGALSATAATTEAATAAEAPTAQAAAAAAIAEAATAADSSSAATSGNYSAGITEAASAADAPSAALTATAAAVEGATAAETASAAAAGNYSAGITEAASAADAPTAALTAAAAAVETATAADAATLTAAFTAAAVEASTAAESSTGLPSGAFAASAAEASTAADTSTTTATKAAAAVEAASAADACTALRVTFAAVLETATPIDVSGASWAAGAPPVTPARRQVVANGSVGARPGNTSGARRPSNRARS